MSKWVTVLMLRICYKYIFGNICVNILKTSMLQCYTYLLTPWSRVLLQKLAGLLLVKKFPAFYETRRFLTAHIVIISIIIIIIFWKKS